MKKLLVIPLIIGIYLYITYAYFYHFIGQKNLLPPIHQINMQIGDQAKPTIKYVVLGDSLSAGTGVSNYQDSYPYLFAQQLSLKSGIELYDFSRAGAISQDVLNQQLPQALSLKPDIVTLLIGINDIHALKSVKEFRENYTSIVSALKQTGAKTYLLSIPYLGSSKVVFFPYNLILDLKTQQFNNVIKKISTDFGLKYIDLYSLGKPANFYSSDQFHPSAVGYNSWLKAFNVN